MSTHHAADELHAFFERGDHVAGDPLQRPPLGVDHHVDDEVAAGVPGDPGVLFVHRIAVEDAAVGLGVLEKVGPVPDLDRLQRRDARADQLSARRRSRPSSAARSGPVVIFRSAFT